MKALTQEQMRRRWIAIGVVAVAYILSFFQRFAPAGIAPDLAAAFETSAASLGVLAATYFYVYTVMQIPTGILVDTLGPRRILVLGGLVGGAGSFLFGMAPTLELALVGRTLIGLGVSVTFIAMLKLIAVWFEENRFATMVGICMLIGNLGSVLAGAPLSAVAQATGWRGVFIAGAGCVVLADRARCPGIRRVFSQAPFRPYGGVVQSAFGCQEPQYLACRAGQYRDVRRFFHLCRSVGDAVSDSGARDGALGGDDASVAVVRRFCHWMPVHRRTF